MIPIAGTSRCFNHWPNWYAYAVSYMNLLYMPVQATYVYSSAIIIMNMGQIGTNVNVLYTNMN